jgi:5-methylcytosine-specific restriction endonuclease McrA
MRVSPNEIKVCEKHNIIYTNWGNSNKRRCAECVKEYNKLPHRLEKKREIDRKYQSKKRLESPDVLKKAQEKYKQTDKYKHRINYYKFKNKEGQYSNIYCIQCNDVRLYGDKLCSKCKLIKKYTDAYNFTSVCKHCNKEYGIETKLNNLSVVHQINNYCSVQCNEQLKNINRKKHQKISRVKRRNKYGRLEKDKEIAKYYGIKYETISRSIVFRKHNYVCASCGVKCVHPNKDNYNQSNAATLDHIIPKSRGGEHTYNNVTLLCRSCNSIKRDTMLTDYKRNISQMHIEFTSYIPQGSQLKLQLE